MLHCCLFESNYNKENQEKNTCNLIAIGIVAPAGVPCQPLLVEFYDYLWAFEVRLRRWHQIGFIRVFPFHQEHQLAAAVGCAQYFFRFQTAFETLQFLFFGCLLFRCRRFFGWYGVNGFSLFVALCLTKERNDSHELVSDDKTIFTENAGKDRDDQCRPKRKSVYSPFTSGSFPPFFRFSSNAEIKSGQSRFSSGSHVLSSEL